MTDPELAALQERLRKLAAEKSYLQLVVRLMSRMQAQPGVQQVAGALLQGTVEVIGGSNLTLWLRIDLAYHRQELSGQWERQELPEDPEVREAFTHGRPSSRVGDFSRTLMQTEAFTQAHTWIQPLRVGREVVAVLRIEDVHFGLAEIQGDLSTFFNYAALVLKNEVMEEGRLRLTVERLQEANERLALEVEEHWQAQEALEEARSDLEQRVQARTTELRRTMDRYRAFFDYGPDGIVVLDPPTGRFLEFNDQACRQLGYTREEFGRLDLFAIDALERPEDSAERIRRVMAEGHDDFETVHLTKTGERRHVHVSAQFFPAGDEGTYHCVWRDITSRREAEEALRRSEEQHRSMLNTATDAIWLIDGESRLIDVNEAACRMLRYTREEMLGRGILAFDHSLPDDERLAHFRQVMARGSGLFETVHTRKDGVEVPVEVSVTVQADRGQVLSYIRDISERRRLESERRALEGELQHLQRMESVGRLAGGIAHDMNNILAAIMSVASLLQIKGGEHAPRAGLILQACHRGRDLIRGLMDFARKEVQDAELTDLNELVRREAELLGSTTLQRVRIQLDLAPDLPRIVGSASALSTALMNLCMNALDAMPEGGRLTLRTAPLSEHAVLLEVQDSGQGMPPEVLSRAMEPFFTTKPVGKGTGLGLSRVFGTVQAHGGSVEIRSQPGQGTLVRITLPLVPGVARATLAVPEPAAGPGRCLEVLLVDDDPLVREATPALLRAMGHQVDTAGGGLEALERLSRGTAPDVVILDLNMPDLTGLETLRRLRRIHPDLPVLVSSGYSDESTRIRLLAEGKVSFLPKPYAPGDLQRALVGVG